MKRRQMMLAGMMTFFILTGNGFAQKKGPNTEQLDRREIRQDVKHLADDRHDVRRLSKLIHQRDRLIEHRAEPFKIRATERRIMAAMRHDLRESARQLKGSRREAGQPVSQKNYSRQNVRDESSNEKPERGESRDAYRDQKDDRQDFFHMARIVAHKREIIQQLERLQSKHRPRTAMRRVSMRKNQLFHQYLQLSKKEIGMDVRELKEDRREKRQEN